MLLKSTLALALVLALPACGNNEDDHVGSPDPNSADALAGEPGTPVAPDCGAPLPLDVEAQGPLSTDIEAEPLPTPVAPKCAVAGELTADESL